MQGINCIFKGFHQMATETIDLSVSVASLNFDVQYWQNTEANNTVPAQFSVVYINHFC